MAWFLGCFGGCPQLIRKPDDHRPCPYPYPYPPSSLQKEQSSRFSEDFGQPNSHRVSVVGQAVDGEYSPPLRRTVSSKQGEWNSPSFNGNGIAGDGTPLSLRSQALLASRSLSCDKRKRPSSSLPYVMRRDPISQMEELERELEEIKQKLILESEEAKKLRDEVRQLRACDKPLQASGETNGNESQAPRVEEANEKSQTALPDTAPVKNIPARPDLILPDREEEPTPDKCFPSSSFQQDSTAHHPPQMQAQSDLHCLSSMRKNGVSRDEKESQYEKNPFLQQHPWPVQRKPSLAANPAGVQRVSPDPLIISHLRLTTPPPRSETLHSFNGERSFSSRSDRSDTSLKNSVARKRRRVSQDQQRNPNALPFFTTHYHRLSDSKTNNVTKTLQKRPESNFISNPSMETSIVSSKSNTSVTKTTTTTVSSSSPSLPASNGSQSYSWTDSVRDLTESYGEESDFESEEGGSLNQPLHCPSPLLISALRRSHKGARRQEEAVSNNNNDYSMTEEETEGTTESNTVSEEDVFIDADSHASSSSVATNQKENRNHNANMTRTSTITNAYLNPKSNPNPNYGSSTVQRSFSSRYASPSVLNSVENVLNWKQFTTTNAMPLSSNNRKNSPLGATNEKGKQVNPTFLGRDSRSCQAMEIEDYSDNSQVRSSSDSVRVDASLKHWVRRSFSSKGSEHRSSGSSNSRSSLSQQSERSSSWSSAASNGHLFGARQPRISSLQLQMYGKKKQGLASS